LGALATKSEDLFYDCKDALDLVLGCCGGGGQELCFLEGDKREEVEEGSSLFLGLMKMEDERKRRRLLSSRG